VFGVKRITLHRHQCKGRLVVCAELNEHISGELEAG
jgi:hypothetical protein